jgi:hypothetical protein
MKWDFELSNFQVCYRKFRIKDLELIKPKLVFKYFKLNNELRSGSECFITNTILPITK